MVVDFGIVVDFGSVAAPIAERMPMADRMPPIQYHFLLLRLTGTATGVSVKSS
jgi:hypothetical protein